MTEKDFEQLKPGDAVVYKGDSPFGEDFTRGNAYEVAEKSECHSVIGIYDDNGKERLYRRAQAPDVFCSQEEWDKKWQFVHGRKDIHVTDADQAVDWEQRRYEIAKAALQGFCCSIVGANTPNDIIAQWSVNVADELIDKLKKSQTQG